MRVIKFGVISIIFLFLLLTAFSLLIPSHVRISKAIDIRTSRDAALQEIENLPNWKKWYPGADSADIYISGERLDLDAPDPRLTVESDSSVIMKVNRNTQSAWILYGSSPGLVTVQWYMDFRLRWYPWEKFSGLLLEGRYGPQMEKGLEKLRTVLESDNR